MARTVIGFACVAATVVAVGGVLGVATAADQRSGWAGAARVSVTGSAIIPQPAAAAPPPGVVAPSRSPAPAAAAPIVEHTAVASPTDAPAPAAPTEDAVADPAPSLGGQAGMVPLASAEPTPDPTSLPAAPPELDVLEEPEPTPSVP
jgi:hypothetical protein